MPEQRIAPEVRAEQADTGNPSVEIRGSDIHLELGTRRYRVRGLERKQSTQQLRVSLLVTRDELVHLDTLDLCQARSRSSFMKAAAAELYVEEATIKQDLGRLLLVLERLPYDGLLQSDGRLRIAAAGKNQGSGRQQTAAIQARQWAFRLWACPRGLAAFALLLSPRVVHKPLNPPDKPGGETFALTFRDDQTRMRRDHAKYLALIAASALVHQHQRPRRSVDGQRHAEQSDAAPLEYIEATAEDAGLAGRLAAEAMGRTLEGLLPQTRQLLVLIDDLVSTRAHRAPRPRSAIRFTQRALREAFSWGDFQVRRHLARLVELEYVLVHRTPRGNQREYELVYDGQGRAGEPFLLGLVDADKLAASLIAPLPKVRNDHLDGRNDAHSMLIRSAFDPPSMPPENGVKRNAAKSLRSSNGTRAKGNNGVLPEVCHCPQVV